MSPLVVYAVTAAIVGASPPPTRQASTAETSPATETAAALPTKGGASATETPATETPATNVTPTPTPDELPTSSETAAPATETPTTPTPTPTSDGATPAFHRPSAELVKRRQAEARRGRILTIAGATLTGIGLAGRIGLDVFLATVADLAPREPYGRWSVGSFVMATTFQNVPTLVGIGLLGGGSYYRARAHGRRFDHPSSRRNKRRAWGLIGGGVGLWGLSRALFLPWTRACRSNACAYGYLEPTYFVSAGLVITGVVLATRESGFERAEAEEKADYIKLHSQRQAPILSPVVGPGFQGLSLSGRF